MPIAGPSGAPGGPPRAGEARGGEPPPQGQRPTVFPGGSRAAPRPSSGTFRPGEPPRHLRLKGRRSWGFRIGLTQHALNPRYCVSIVIQSPNPAAFPLDKDNEIPRSQGILRILGPRCLKGRDSGRADLAQPATIARQVGKSPEMKSYPQKKIFLSFRPVTRKPLKGRKSEVF